METVRIHPGGASAAVGAVRWTVEWQQLTPAAAKRRAADSAGYEHDRDVDEVSVTRAFTTEAAALASARRLVDGRRTVYGVATVTQERVVWLDRRRGVGEWEDAAEPDYVD